MEKEVTIKFDNAQAAEPVKATIDGDFSGGGGSGLLILDFSVQNPAWKYGHIGGDTQNPEFIEGEYDPWIGHHITKSKAGPDDGCAVLLDEQTAKDIKNAGMVCVKMASNPPDDSALINRYYYPILNIYGEFEEQSTYMLMLKPTYHIDDLHLQDSIVSVVVMPDGSFVFSDTNPFDTGE